jgi:N-acetylglucosaminyl-diphospho-decaprenol L-rhamnosyltransferase
VAAVDVVVVSFNSADTLRDCVEPLAADDSTQVIVVDNASTDGTLATVADLPVGVLALERNHGFAFGCNRGWQTGSAPFVLFLNPDARIDVESLRRLVARLEADESAGLVAPRLLEADGSLELSQRRFPRLRSTYAQALFLPRLFPRRSWVDEVVHDRAPYDRPCSPEWVSGACMLLRRSALERVGGWDERFFMYSEDKDLCRRLRAAGFGVRYEPAATVVHVGGVSAPRASLLPVLAASRILYASKHHGRAAALLERLGIALGSLTHALLTSRGRATRAGYLRSAAVALGLGAKPAGQTVRGQSVPTAVEDASANE